MNLRVMLIPITSELTVADIQITDILLDYTILKWSCQSNKHKTTDDIKIV